MNIIVCVKQVPNTNEVKIDPKTNNLVREGIPNIINPYDENGMEAALALRDIHGGSVTAISMGPLQTEETLEYCLKMGADDAILVSDRKVGGSDTLATGYVLTETIKKMDYDLIICGSEAVDGCTGQVGPIIAGNLGIAQMTYVRDISFEKDTVKVQREVGKYIEHYETKLPALICVLKSINTPRPLKCLEKNVRKLTADDLVLDADRIGNTGSPTRVVDIKMCGKTSSNFVMIDDSLDWEGRMRMIINGGLEKKIKIDFWRGTPRILADKILTETELKNYI